MDTVLISAARFAKDLGYAGAHDKAACAFETMSDRMGIHNTAVELFS